MASQNGGKMTKDEGRALLKNSRVCDFDKIGITDDLMFGEVFRNEEACKELLQRLLGIEITELQFVEEQKGMKKRRDKKGIRIDVYAKDVEGNTYDIEMQVKNTGNIDLRSRYYHSQMDSYQLKLGQNYKKLKLSIVIFVCAFDLFKDNRSIYTFESICTENTAIKLQDKRKTLFINLCGDRTGLDEKTVNLLDYFKTGKPTDEYTESLQREVERIRCDDEWRENNMTYEMKLEERYEEGIEEGMEVGIQQGINIERENTIRERERADAAEEEIRRLLKLIGPVSRFSTK